MGITEGEEAWRKAEVALKSAFVLGLATFVPVTPKILSSSVQSEIEIALEVRDALMGFRLELREELGECGPFG